MTPVMRLHLLALSLLAAACGSNPADPSPGVDGPPGGTDAPIAPDGTAARDPAGDGDATVTEATASIPGKTAGRTLAATVYTPSSPAPRPVVVVSPGFQMPRTQYASYAHHLASWGFVVVLTDYAGGSLFPDHQKLADDVTAVIDWALAQAGLGADAQRIATAGHSLGGKISIFAATQDPRIKAVVAWDPVDSNNPSVAPEKMSNLAAAVAVAGETTNGSGGGMPCAPAADNFLAFYGAARAPALAITVGGADHMDWVDDPSCGFCSFCTAGTAPEARARTISRRLDVAWLRRQLLGDAAMDPWLDAPPEVTAGTATIVRK